jgi:phosphatidylglycerol:prolipoprotein diacylglycerol transferase
MTIFNFIIWNGSPVIFDIGFFPLRWYGLLFALGFVVSQQILYYVYQSEGKPKTDVDTLTIYVVLATLIGARFGHVLFYQPEILLQDPLSVVLPFKFKPEFEFTGFQGLASHGGALGILIALYLYARKKRPGQNYLQVVDRIVIVVAITGALIRLGNFFNSEIIGKPTHNQYGVVFARHITDLLETESNVINVSYQKNDDAPNKLGYPAVDIDVEFSNNIKYPDNFVRDEILEKLRFNQYAGEHIDQTAEMTYSIKGKHAIIKAYLIPRYPAQLMESFSCVILFLILFMIWRKYKQDITPGLLLGIFLVTCFGLRFFYEFLKINQEDFESKLPINMGQILSIPLIVAGIVLLIRASRKTKDPRTNTSDK